MSNNGTDTIKADGACMCGAVKFTANAMSKSAGACHCKMCRRWSGGPNMTIDCGSEISFEGEENIGRYKSSEWAERGFCKICGSNLFWRMLETNQHIISAGLIDDETVLNFDHQIYIDHKPDYYEFKNETHSMTEAEVIEAFAPEE
jgi:hypothetical protein